MKSIVFLITFIWSTIVFGALQSGDIILLPMTCYECKMIEAETDGPYSHSGLVLIANNETYILQSLGSVFATKIDNFLKMKDPSRDIKVIRPKEFIGKDYSAKMLTLFTEKYEGLPFDHDYLWDNYEEDGEEKLYCSEFIAKFLNNFLTVKIQPTPMTYYNYPDYWKAFFKDSVPNGQLGNSPNSFLRTGLFVELN